VDAVAEPRAARPEGSPAARVMILGQAGLGRSTRKNLSLTIVDIRGGRVRGAPSLNGISLGHREICICPQVQRTLQPGSRAVPPNQNQ
jgi:hypothetical protein